MSSSRSTNKRSLSEFEDSQDNVDATFNEDDVRHNTDTEEQIVTTLLPPRKKTEGRNYVSKAQGRRADYWEHFWEYKENGKHRAEWKQTEIAFDHDVDVGQDKMKAWVLNVDDARNALAYMIIVDELPFRHVEKPDEYDDNHSSGHGSTGEDEMRNSGAPLESDWKVV
uniref:Uncharacterized protein n=1 Tax=Chenopodium quinoa TaxID=63459 RepID=A0A803MEB9_CHEQI